METSFDKEMKKARSALVLDFPFFAMPVFQVAMKIDETCPTGWTDGKVIAVNPEWFLAQKKKHRITFYAHEGLHPAFGHHVRMIPLVKNQRDHSLFNAAADYVVNLILTDAGLELPPGGLLDERFRDMQVEKVFYLLQKEEKEDPGRHTGQGGGATMLPPQGQPGGGGQSQDDGDES